MFILIYDEITQKGVIEMLSDNNRINREKKTIENMIKLYCKKNHKSNKYLCKEYAELLNYSNKRLDSCRFGENKPTCGKCKIHCYKKEMRDRMKSVMRYAGPKMLISHPIVAIQHYIDGFRK
ncbi:MAG: nitrous oxide-stimulated promoter family protein [Halanaerobiales bacterium]|nr:nitrous oxide-stimulated promoter family protein [Halanaerobiales bacterium]